jgi:hypothetical protein
MEVDKKEATVLQNAIQFWQDSSKISPELADDLRNSYQLRDSNADTITWYAFISAISCGLLAFGALVIDEKWIELLRNQWGFSETVVGIGFSLVAVLFVILAKRRRLKYPTAKASNETYTITIILSVAVAIAYWTRSFAYFEGNYARPLLIAAVVYLLSAAYLNSQLLWTVMLLTVAGWWGAQTYFWTGGAYRFAGMNYPLNMTLFGLIIWGCSWVVGKIKTLQSFSAVTYAIGLFLFLLAAWTLSIFGNYDNLDRWTAIRQGTLWYWSLGYSLVLAGLIAYAIQNKNDVLRDMCLLFFLLNIYTRYFEYFWDRTNKGIFFAILAVSFWFVGKKAEQWRNKEKQKS